MLVRSLSLRATHPVTRGLVCPVGGRGALYGRESWVAVMLLLILVELGCVGLWAATGSGPPLLAALATGLAIVYMVVFSGR
jgi:hypothetical protein